MGILKTRGQEPPREVDHLGVRPDALRYGALGADSRDTALAHGDPPGE